MRLMKKSRSFKEYVDFGFMVVKIIATVPILAIEYARYEYSELLKRQKR
jgi:hypothetical protein